jgi:hypothetical protein
MTFTNKEIAQQLEDVTARIEALIHIGGMLTDSERIPDSIREMLSELDGEQIDELFPGIPDWAIENSDDGDYSDFTDWVYEQGRLGFLVQFATPIMRGDESCRTYSWGCYGTRWVYAETLSEAVELGLKWVAERRAQEALKSAATA